MLTALTGATCRWMWSCTDAADVRVSTVRNVHSSLFHLLHTSPECRMGPRGRGVTCVNCRSMFSMRLSSEMSGDNPSLQSCVSWVAAPNTPHLNGFRGAPVKHLA